MTLSKELKNEIANIYWYYYNNFYEENYENIQKKLNVGTTLYERYRVPEDLIYSLFLE